MAYDVLSFPSDKPLADAVAAKWLQALAASSLQKSPFLVALSGGRIARTFFSAVVQAAAGNTHLFDRVHFFWADERCVPPDDPESNYRVAKELLLEPLGISEAHIHRIRGEQPAEAAASSAAQELLTIAPRSSANLPLFDLIFLGMGEDGHVASLFPDKTHETVRQEVYLPVRATKPPPERVTLSYHVIGAATEVWVLASGPGKEAALRQSLMPDASTPLGKVLRARGHTLLLTDIQKVFSLTA